MTARRVHPRYSAPSVTRVALMQAVRAGMQGLRAIPRQRLGDWAQEHFVLDGDSSHRKGRWEAWPFQVGILDAMSNDDIEQLDVQKAKRVGYTKCLVASIGYDAAHRPRKQGVYQPTDEDRDSFVRTEVQPMLDGVRAVANARRTSRANEETVRLRQFRGTVAHFLGGKAARAYRRITLAVVKFDELDGFDQVIEKSSDPITLGRGRLEGAPFPKLICGSTPRVKGLSHIERQVGLADAKMRYCVPCMHCGIEHPLLWGGKKLAHGFKWDQGDPMSVRHVCPHCREPIRQADYLRVWKQGAWVCDVTGLRYGQDRVWRNDRGEPVRPPRHVAFHGLWTAYSPQRAWSDIVVEFLAAKRSVDAGDAGPMQGFTNETLAETWEEAYEQTESSLLQRRAKAERHPMMVVPRDACVVVGTVDVQADRWEYMARAIGRDGQAWVIDYRVLYGNPAALEEWKRVVEPLIDATYRHAGGARIRISGLAIDTGYLTHTCYEFVRRHKHRGVYAVKGDGKVGLAIKSRRTLVDVNIRGKKLRKGVELWTVGTDTAKDLLHGRLQLEGDGPGRQHFAAELPESFFKGMTAEKRLQMRTAGGTEQRWVCPAGHRNEPLDLMVYSMFLEEVLEIPRWTSRQWERAESALHPDLFEAYVEQAAAEPSPPTTPPEASADEATEADSDTTDDDDAEAPADEAPAAAPPTPAAAPEPPPVDLARRRAVPVVPTTSAPSPFGNASWGSRL